MALRLDLRTVGRAMRVARRLTADSSPEGLSLFRELLATLGESREFFEVLAWIVPKSQSLAVENIAVLSRRLPAIVRTFGASGYSTEAVRIMATGAGLAPGLSAEFTEAVGLAFSRPSAKPSPAMAAVAAAELSSVGFDLLEAGSPEGITLMGAAHRVDPSVKLPIEGIRRHLNNLQDRRPVSLQIEDAQAVTNVAYDLHFSGRSEPAVRVGTVIPSILQGWEADRLFKQLEASAVPEVKAAFEVSHVILNKGYPTQAANLLLDSGAVSADDIWASLDKNIIVPSKEIETPNRFNFYLRSVRNLVKSSPIGPPDSSFYFALEGKDARCDQVLWGATFDLVFRYDVLPADALAGLKGKKLEELLREKVSLYINVQPVALTLTDDIPGRVAHFEGGKMIGEPPRFRLKAPKKDFGPDHQCGVDVTFFLDRALLYRFFLPIQPVDKLDESLSNCPKQVIDLDLPEVLNSEAGKRDAVLFITKKGGAWSVYYYIEGDSRPPEMASVSPADLADKYEQDGIIKEVTRVVEKAVWKQIDSDLKIPDTPEMKAELRECTQALMRIGSKLYLALAGDPAFKTAFDKIEKLEPGSKITIITEGVAFPWELFYPLYYDNGSGANYQPDQFWGKRFQIEQLLFTPTETDKLPRDRTQPGTLKISMGLNEGIDKEWKERPILPVKFQKDYCDRTLSTRGEHMETQDSIAKILKEPYLTSFIYFFCHGDETHLEFEESKPPLEVHSLSPDQIYPGWPLVFLNACSSGNISPLSFSSFRTRFRQKKAAGLVAPTFPIPTLFAAVLGKVVLDEYAARRPIGQILFDLRGRLLEQDNALGLLYSLQCPLDVRAPEQ